MDGEHAEFAASVRALIDDLGLSLREAAGRMAYDPAYLSRVLTGKQKPSAKFRRAVDQLRPVAVPASVVDEDERARVRWALENPSRIDGPSVTALADVLAAQRRMDDIWGPHTMLPAIVAQARTARALLKDARGPHRDTLAEVIAEWVQFEGWLLASARHDDRAVTVLEEAGELAHETEDGTLVAQARNFRGYLSRQQRFPQEYARWFAFAYRTPGASAAQRMGDAAQAAQGFADLGMRSKARRLLDEALALSDEAASAPPRTAYWLTAEFQLMNLGLAHLGLGDFRQAAALIRAGLNGLPAELRAAPWAAEHKEALAQAESHA
ncbi:hypothetical protein ACF06N_02220 [Streptomyces albidoflavus]